MSDNPVQSLFLRDGKYHFSRWAKPLSPVIFGVDDSSLIAIKEAFSDVLSLTPLKLSEFDPDLGANLLMFFCSRWPELSTIPNLNKLIPNLVDLLETLDNNQANQYRTFSFSPDGAINFVVVLLKYDLELSSVSVQTLAVSQMLQSVLLWSPDAFKEDSPIAVVKQTNRCVVKPFYAALLKAAYDPVLPNYSLDEIHAMRLEARVGVFMKGF